MEELAFGAEEITTLRNLATIGANDATQALTRMLNTTVSVMTVEADILPIEKLAETVGSAQDMVTTVTMPLFGAVYGNMALILPQDRILKLADLLSKREVGTTKELSEMDQSALKETANIVAGTFLVALSRHTQLMILEDVPMLSTGTVKATIEGILSRFPVRSKATVALQINFEFGTAGGGLKVTSLFCLTLTQPRRLLVGLEKRRCRIYGKDSYCRRQCLHAQSAL